MEARALKQYAVLAITRTREDRFADHRQKHVVWATDATQAVKLVLAGLEVVGDLLISLTVSPVDNKYVKA